MDIDGYVLSYLNPDTDGICTSLAVAELYRLEGKGKYQIVLEGKLSEETRYVLNEAGINTEKFVTEYDKGKSVILVDTHQLMQLPHLENVEKVIEIWDHHPDGDDEKFVNANIHNYKIGAIASKVLEELWKIDGLNRTYSILLGSAIISNTINFTAPSVTQYDKDMFLMARNYFDFSEEYINGLFQCRDVILNTGLRNILMHDMKYYDINGRKCLMIQLELFSPKRLLECTELGLEMQNLKTEKVVDYLLLNITDVQQKKSYLVCGDSDSKKIVEKMFGRSFTGNKMEFNKILLRKTDLFPLLSKVLSNVID